jgi:hypothetical protein
LFAQLHGDDPGQLLVADLPLTAARAPAMSSGDPAIINRSQQRMYQTARQPHSLRLERS